MLATGAALHLVRILHVIFERVLVGAADPEEGRAERFLVEVGAQGARREESPWWSNLH